MAYLFHFSLLKGTKTKYKSKGKNFLYMRISEGMHLFTSYKKVVFLHGNSKLFESLSIPSCFIMNRFDMRQVNRNSIRRRESVYLSSREVFQVGILRQRIRTFHRWCQNSKSIFNLSKNGFVRFPRLRSLLGSYIANIFLDYGEIFFHD